jgi:hypothetical protein
MNIIVDARTNKKPLHIIYTDIKGAFPSVPYQAFTDALTSLGLSGPFLNLIYDTQHDFTVIARGPTGYSSNRPKVNGVHEGNCLSPTLFCLVLNMFFIWVASQNLGYNMEGTGPENKCFKVRVSVNGYADDMALIGNSTAEANTILHMLERFLAYYGMELNASKCAYQFRTEDPLFRPTTLTCRWGDIPIYHGKTSYKYLGYYINTQLDFTYQFQQMVQKLETDCASFYSKHPMSMQKAIVYVNSDLVSKLRYPMYLINFPKTYLKQFKRILVGTIKRLAHLAKSTPTDLLIFQGFHNVFDLQAVIRADFLQNCLQAPDLPCRISS